MGVLLGTAFLCELLDMLYAAVGIFIVPIIIFIGCVAMFLVYAVGITIYWVLKDGFVNKERKVNHIQNENFKYVHVAGHIQ